MEQQNHVIHKTINVMEIVNIVVIYQQWPNSVVITRVQVHALYLNKEIAFIMVQLV